MDFTDSVIPTPRARRERNRAEMTAAILEAARAIMQEHGAGGLNLSELARRVNLTTPALYSYFDNKFAIYDALYIHGLRIVREYDLNVFKTHEPGWERLRAWMQARPQFAIDHPDLYQLMFTAAVPGFVPSREGVTESQKQLENTRRGLSEIIDAGMMSPPIETNQAVDLLLAIRHGILAERIGKSNVVPLESGRFATLVDDAIEMLQLAWAPGGGTTREEGVEPG